jgi:CBS domain-containing protein
MPAKKYKKVSEIMIAKVITFKTDDTLETVAEKFVKNKISGAPVINDKNEVIGIVSENDLLKALRASATKMDMVFPSAHNPGVYFEKSVDFTKIDKAFEKLGKLTVSEIMNAEVITLEPDDDLMKAGKTLIEKDVNHIPIVKDKKLVGIVAREDIIRGFVS